MIVGCHSWHWNNPEADTVVPHTHLLLVESQGQIESELDSTPTNDSPTNYEPPSDISKPVIIHPGSLTIPNITLNPILNSPIYQKMTPLIQNLLMQLSISSKE